jgi:outer membrane lipoprotein-sorting protein
MAIEKFIFVDVSDPISPQTVHPLYSLSVEIFFVFISSFSTFVKIIISNMYRIVLSFAIMMCSFGAFSQNADEIITNCVNALGGKNWENVSGLRYVTNVEQGGMKIPLEIVQMKDGKMYTKITFQGMEITQGAFDGEVAWNTNFMTQKAEKAESEDTENAKRTAHDFPNALYVYKKAGYTATYEGEQNVDGAACYKIKLDKKTMLSEGKEVPNIEYYYIDKESNALIMTESEITSGEMKGQIAQSKFSDYQEVSGVFMPFSQSMGLKDGDSQSLSFEKIEVNPTVSETNFKYPGE